MHIPDGFLSTQTWVSGWLISFGGMGYCLRKTNQVLKDKIVPLMGMMSAFIFAAQMLNFPVMGGTSGHLIGGVLAAILLGPYAAAIVLACVLTAQCFIFQDGGLTALGANILNMAFVGTFGGYFIYKLIRRIIAGNKGILAGSAVAAWSSVVLASVICSLELAVSGTSRLGIVLPVMVAVHALIGIGEAIITTLVVGFVIRVRPDLLFNEGERQ